jgi:hypothetical protein
VLIPEQERPEALVVATVLEMIRDLRAIQILAAVVAAEANTTADITAALVL